MEGGGCKLSGRVGSYRVGSESKELVQKHGAGEDERKRLRKRREKKAG